MTGILLGGLGSCLREQGRYDEAEAALLRGIEVLVAAVGEAHPATRETVGRLRTLYGPDAMNDGAKLEALEGAGSPAAPGPGSSAAPG